MQCPGKFQNNSLQSLKGQSQLHMGTRIAKTNLYNQRTSGVVFFFSDCTKTILVVLKQSSKLS